MKKQKIDLKTGEAVRLEFAFGMPGSGIYRVKEIGNQMVYFSAGGISAGSGIDCFKVIERLDASNVDWLQAEIEILQNQVKMCDCKDCRKHLSDKKIELAARNQAEQTH